MGAFGEKWIANLAAQSLMVPRRDKLDRDHTYLERLQRTPRLQTTRLRQTQRTPESTQTDRPIQ